MGTTAISGPQIVYGPSAEELNVVTPSLFAWGTGFYDTRNQYAPGSASIPQGYGFAQQSMFMTMNANIYEASIIAPLQNAVANVPLTLNTVAAPGFTPGQSVRSRSTGQIITNVTMLDDFNTAESYGVQVAKTSIQAGNFNLWDPTTLSSRRLLFTAGTLANTFTIEGTDIYGYPMTETVPMAAGQPASSLKSFKGIISITPSVSDATNISVEMQPDIGLPIRYDNPQQGTDSGMATFYENGTLTNPSALQSSLYDISDITHLSGILTITILADAITSSRSAVIPVGSQITIEANYPPSFNGTYTVLTSGPGTLTVASTNTDEFDKGGTIFCNQSGISSADVRGVYQITAAPAVNSPVNLIVYQAIPLLNMLSNDGQFGVTQFSM